MANNVEKIMGDYLAAMNAHDLDKMLTFFTDDAVYDCMPLGKLSKGKKEIKDFFSVTTWRLEAPQDFMYGGVCHPLDSLVWLLGEVEEVHCYANRGDLSDYPIEDNFMLNLKFKNGVMARVLGAYGIVQPPMPMMP